MTNSYSQKQDTEQGVSVKTAAKFFGVQAQTIREWCKLGKLPAFRTPSGRIAYIPESALVLHKAEGAGV